MAETLTVALHVAEEAIDEAISKAEFNSASQKKQNEAHYLREHRGELIEELAKTIVQKIISRRKTLAEMRAEYDRDWALEQNADLHRPQSSSDQASSSIQQQPGLWRSHSAFSLSANETPGLIQDCSQALKKDGGSAMSAWRSVDRLDNAGVSSVLKSPDGNWIALQSAQLSRPTLLTKRKSLVYSALERESGVVSAYEGMDSDNEAKPELDSSWGAVLQEIHRKMTDSNLNLQDTRDRITSTVTGHQGSRDDVLSDSEGIRKPNKPLLALFKKKLPAEIRRPSSSRRTSIIDVNFNVEPTGEEEHSSVCAEPEVGKVRRLRRKRKSKKEQVAPSADVDLNRSDNQSDHTSDPVTPDTLTSGPTTPEPLDRDSDIAGHRANQRDEQLQQLEGHVPDLTTREEERDDDMDAEHDDDDDDGQRVERRQGSENRDDENEKKMEIDLDEDQTGDEKEEEEIDLELDDEDMKDRLYRLVAQSRLTYFSSTDEELDKADQSEEKWEEDKDENMVEDNEETEGLTYRLCQLEKEVRATQFSSTEDELDRVAVDEEEEVEGEELAMKVCRLADQVNATQFSSTEEELDAAERGEEEEDVINEQTLWKLQAEKTVEAAQLRDLASLVSASQFSSTEDEPDRAGENDGVTEQEENEGGSTSSTETDERWVTEVERRESFGDLDVKMFGLRAEIEEMRNDDSDAKVKDILNSEITIEDVPQDNMEVEGPENNDLVETKQRGETENERTGVKKCEEELEDEAERDEREEIKTEERTEEIEEKRNKTRVQQENQPEAKWPNKEEGDRQGEETFKESKVSQVKWETAADSNEEDETEFDRIISSMLMMTFEEVQGETLKDEAAENVKVNRELEDGETPEETGSGREFESGGDMRPEPAATEQQGENETEQSGGRVSRGNESRDDTNQHDSVHEERNVPTEKLETNEAEQTCETQEVDKVEVQGGITAQGENANEVMEEKCEQPKGNPDDTEQSSTSLLHEGLLSPQEIQSVSDMELYRTVEFLSTLLEQRYSAVALCSITTEVLKVLNATEDLLQGVEEGERSQLPTPSLPPDSDPKKLDQQFSRLEENVYVAAGSVYSLEAELSDLEECARGICSSTSDMELSYLEEQVASAAAKVQQSELQICDISSRIAALKSAGLNVDTQSRLKTRTIPVMPVTLDSSRQLRRRLPAPPAKEDKDT